MPADSLYIERIAGARSGPVLIFLHHGLGCVTLWRDFPAKMAEATGLPVLVYDRQGHGRSPALSQPRGPRYLYEEAQALGSLLTQTETRDYILIGHSDGGSIALLHAASETGSRPRGVISEAAHLFVENVTRGGIRAAVDSYRPLLRERLLRHHGGKTDSLFWNWAGTWLAPSFDSFNICAAVRPVRCPVLAIQGAADEYGTAAQWKAIQANCSGLVEAQVIPQCGHDPHQQAFDATFSAMRRAVAAWL